MHISTCVLTYLLLVLLIISERNAKGRVIESRGVMKRDTASMIGFVPLQRAKRHVCPPGTLHRQYWNPSTKRFEIWCMCKKCKRPRAGTFGGVDHKVLIEVEWPKEG